MGFFFVCVFEWNIIFYAFILFLCAINEFVIDSITSVLMGSGSLVRTRALLFLILKFSIHFPLNF